jgi:hypothetical protein
LQEGVGLILFLCRQFGSQFGIGQMLAARLWNGHGALI